MKEIPTALIAARSASSRSAGLRYCTTLVALNCSAVSPSSVSVGSTITSLPIVPFDSTRTGRGIVSPRMVACVGSLPSARSRLRSKLCSVARTISPYVRKRGNASKSHGVPQRKQRHAGAFQSTALGKSVQAGRGSLQHTCGCSAISTIFRLISAAARKSNGRMRAFPRYGLRTLQVERVSGAIAGYCSHEKGSTGLPCAARISRFHASLIQPCRSPAIGERYWPSTCEEYLRMTGLPRSSSVKSA